jgi:nucleotide-binding universal stress UspA family protein
MTSPNPEIEDLHAETLRLPTGPIIVATDGTPDSDSAIIGAQLFAARTQAPVQLVTVLEPDPVYGFDTGSAPADSTIYGPRRRLQRELVHDQLRRLLPASTQTQVTTLDGSAAQALAREAHDRHARALVLGRGRHGLVHRLLLGETVLRVLQLADVPVFAAESGISGLPKRILIATDFSPYSVYAARIALSMVDPGANILLVHAAPRNNQLEAELERVRHEIGAEHMQVQRVVLSGDPGSALVDFAASSNADLVVSGTHGYGFFNRLILGSVATQLVRGAPSSVLIVPGSAATRAATRERLGHGLTRSVPAKEWSRALATFTRKNAGRQCSAEIDDQQLGAQMQGGSLPLIGAAYDHHGDEVQLMFGAAGLAGRYLSHVVPDVTAVDILADADGRDRALRVSSGSGSTLLTFVD